MVSEDTQKWRDAAACRGVDTDIFYPIDDNGDSIEDFQVLDELGNPGAYCLNCPVREKCLEYAIENLIYDGVFGGFNEKHRRAMINAHIRKMRSERREHRQNKAR